MPKISIITICYNAASVITSTLESVAMQSYDDIEYIIVDGASRDDTLTKVAEICPRAIVKSEPDRGIYDAMNKGICLASGDYLWFLNAGDSLRHKDSVKQVVESINREGTPAPDILYGDTMIVSDKREDVGLRRLRPPHHLCKEHFLRGMLVCHQAFIVARKIVLPYSLHYRLSSDYDWCIRMLERSRHTLEISAILVNYLQGGLSEKKHWQSLRERFCIMRKHFGWRKAITAHLSFFFIPKEKR